MASDYTSIHNDNVRRYGTDIGRIGPMLLADRYDDRTHFIYELLQNAEDALARRPRLDGPRSVTFRLTETALSVSQFGQPFNEADVRGICGIAESTKDLNAIGRFGIGFKSVYAFTDRPEVHSGTEDFAIESFVWPVATPSIERDPDETVILIPLKSTDNSGRDEIAAGLERLGASALLFLRQIEEIHWRVEGGRSGQYLRESEVIDPAVRRVTVIGQEHGKPDVDEEWLVFSRPVTADDGRHAGHVEIAFSLVRDDETERHQVRRVGRSPLVVFFPTVLETHLGFLVQGPYRTTPSRDNVPWSDRWNQHLVSETGSLLVEALRWLRDQRSLDTVLLRCLPLDPAKFGEASMFAPLFEATKEALSSEPLLPRYDAGYVPAARALLGRTQELRDLITATQLSTLYGEKHEPAWLSSDITQERAPELRRYLMQELDVAEVAPETIIPRLDQNFLEAQPDDWILKLYEFLSGQQALRWRLDDMPLIRLENGSHARAQADGLPQAFLPGTITTGFPTVRAAVCATKTAREFLRSLGLTEPDPVDDVVRNVLPKYQEDEVDVRDADYEADIRRILTAFATDSKTQREKLIAALRETAFVMAVDAGNDTKSVSMPGEVYLATERLRDLFAGVKGVLLVDDGCACLRGEDVRDLLEACGATRYLQPVPAETGLSWEQRSEVRRNAGLERASWERPISDMTLRGLGLLLSLLPQLEAEARRHKAALLWDAIADVENRRGSRAFLGEYTWGYSHQTKTASFDAAFVRCLNETAWVPDGNGELQRPEFIIFDTLGWKLSPFLESKIRFKPPVIEALAREAGIEPAVLDLLKKLGLTSEAELRVRLGIKDEPQQSADKADRDSADDDQGEARGSTPDATEGEPQAADDGEGRGSGRRSATRQGGGDGTGQGSDGDDRAGDRKKGAGTGASARAPGSVGDRPFISYVGVHPDDEPDPDGLDREARMALEEQAIKLILTREPQLRRTPPGNPGYDLFEAGEDGEPIRWVEVKAMTSCLDDHPVGVTHTQFECARANREAYWLYVVEHADDEGKATILRVNDPAGKARTFTFDHGWRAVAEPG